MEKVTRQLGDAARASARISQWGPDALPRQGTVGPLGIVTRPGDAFPRRGTASATLTHVSRYRLRSTLCSGLHSHVFEAWDPLLSRVVAVKTLQFGLPMTARIELDRLLLAEARAASDLNHRHIATIHDAGLSAHGVYVAMEYLQGRDLGTLLRNGWHPSVRDAVKLARRVADALAHAHARGMIHCAIKPANLFVTRSGRPKVLDFGLARVATSSAVPALERLSLVTTNYLSPEQVAGGVIDARTDVFSLGAVLYEMLSGVPAFPGDDADAVRQAIASGTREPLDRRVATLPESLVKLVEWSLATDPAQRPPTAAAFSAALRGVIDQLGPQHGLPRAHSAAFDADGPPGRWSLTRLARRLLGGGGGARPSDTPAEGVRVELPAALLPSAPVVPGAMDAVAAFDALNGVNRDDGGDHREAA